LLDVLLVDGLGTLTYRVEESKRRAGIKLQNMGVPGLDVLGLAIVALEGNGDWQSRALVASELRELGKLLCLPRCGGSRLFLSSLLAFLAGGGFDFGVDLGLLLGG
jgi:hypothetical protein